MSGPILVSGGSLMCTMGTMPSTFTAMANPQVKIGGVPAATMMDNAPLTSIKPFGMCTSLANPAVAAATAAALGVLTPQPCLPVIPGPWMASGQKIRSGGKAFVCQGDCLMCAYAGSISIANSGQTKVITN